MHPINEENMDGVPLSTSLVGSLYIFSLFLELKSILLHVRYLSLLTQIEETISYKYPIVKCNKGHRYYAIKLCFWC